MTRRVGHHQSASGLGYDYNVAARSARNFQEVGISLLTGFTESLPEGSTLDAPEEIGRAVCAATNLALSLELYMKATFIADGLTPPKGHNLLSLFHELSPEVRADITRIYSRLISKVELPTEASFTVAVGIRDSPKWGDRSEPKTDLHSVLRRSHNAFVDWRYLFEIAIPKGQKYQWHRFEHLGLRTACDAFFEHLRGTQV